MQIFDISHENCNMKGSNALINRTCKGWHEVKYYLETNALRALGGAVGKNKELLSNSYTSIFSIFEIIKGINFDLEIDNKENTKRKNIFRVIDGINISIIDKMPNEMILAGFSAEGDFNYYQIIGECLDSIRNNKKIDSSNIKKLSESYNKIKIEFKNKIKNRYNIKTPEKTYIRIGNLNDYIVKSNHNYSENIKNIPEGEHPSRLAIEFLRKRDVVYLYRNIFKDNERSEEEIFSLYTGSLDLFIFAAFSYELQKKTLRLEAENNDFLDVYHCLYLINKDQCIVTDDKIFNYWENSEKNMMPKAILPNINVISVSEYRKLI